MSDLSLFLDKNLANALLPEVPILLLKNFCPATLLRNADPGDVEIGIEPLMESHFDERAEITDLAALIEEAFVDAVCDANPDAPSGRDGHEALVETLRRQIGNDRQHVRAELSGAFSEERGRDDLRSDLTNALARALEVEVSWLKLWIYQRPPAVVSSPIELRNPALVIQARIRPCVRLFASSRCATLTTPILHSEGSTLELALSTRPPIVYARPSFRDLDLVLHARIFGSPLAIRIGVTRRVNRELARRTPLSVLDVTHIRRPIRETNGHGATKSIAVKAQPGLQSEFDREVG